MFRSQGLEPTEGGGEPLEVTRGSLGLCWEKGMGGNMILGETREDFFSEARVSFGHSECPDAGPGRQQWTWLCTCQAPE